MTTPTPIDAWIACALCAATLPLCIYPLSTLRRERTLLLQSHSRRWHATMVILWAVVLVSHMGLILYSVTAATEKICRDGSVSDFGWTVGPPACQRRVFLSVINILEYSTAPFYPLYIMSTYARLRPTKSKRVKTQLKVAVAVVSLILGACTAVLIFSSAFDALLVISLNPAFQAIAHLGDYLYHQVFDLWAASLILCATSSLVCAIRLIPFLNVNQKSSSGQLSRFRAVATARLSNASAVMKSSPVLSVSLPGQQASTGSQHMSGGEASSATVSAPPGASSDARSKAVHNCLRQLKMLLLVLGLVLVGDIVMVVCAQSLSDVLFTVLGWLSCRIVSVSLFAAINLIRKTVIARRKVPNPAVGSLATEWQGATTRKMG